LATKPGCRYQQRKGINVVKWSVALEATGDRLITREEVVELADAVAIWSGVASGIGTTTYGAQIVVEAEGRDDAVARAKDAFAQAVAKAGLPPWPVTNIATLSEAESELEDAFDPDPTSGWS
jgi:hypothetical protein